MQETPAQSPTLRQQAEAAAELHWRRSKASVEYFIQNFVWIEDKLVPEKVSRFSLWPAQVGALAMFLVERFILALKARQLGFTWLVLAYAIWRMLFNPGFTAVAVSRTEDDAIELVDYRLATILLPRLPRWMIRRRSEAPEWWGGPVWSANKHELVIEFPGGAISRFKADAGPEAGRSITADLAILDEWAANQWAAHIWEAAFPIINRPGEGPAAGQVFIISTNKRATLFEQQVIDARKGRTDFKLLFWSWFTDPRRDAGWYEATKRSLPQSYKQEYPATVDDALSAGESTAFPEFDSREGGVHVCRPFPIPKWWRRWLANDPGYTDPFAWYWLATDESGENVYIYRELSREPGSDRLTWSQQSAKVNELSQVGSEVPGRQGEMERDEETGKDKPVRERLDFCVTGMDAFNRHPETGKAPVDYYREGGLNWISFLEPVHGPGARAAMKGTWHEYLKVFDGPDGRPVARLHIFSTCTQLIESVPMLVRDEKKPEQVAEMPIDHWYQGAGYGLQAWHARRSRAPDPPKAEVKTAKERLMQRLNAQRRGLRRP